ncbi:hypothetical protein HOLleu_24790 [Holothuria leucospilota]|uniref:Uncharacterized protein n=1 Tax=Holothuria leucospilota TaxID=206669 RepID=A0A9Q1H3W7_HOLLE|nr:hypothetical protein HOLleu_24790 [Holothuria leucospilota]
MLVHWAEVGDNPEVVWSKLRAEGFEVDIETVNNLLRGGPKTIYEEAEPAERTSNAEQTSKMFESVVGVDNIASYCKRKVKLTDDILQLVSATLEEDEVHSLLSLKRALEKKGVEISKTSVFRALEKLGRSIVEKKKKMNHPSGLRTPDSLGPKVKTGPRTVAEMLQSQGRNVAEKRTRIVIPRAVASPGIQQPKRLRTLLPKPVETSGSSTSTVVAAQVTSTTPMSQVSILGLLK